MYQNEGTNQESKTGKPKTVFPIQQRGEDNNHGVHEGVRDNPFTPECDRRVCEELQQENEVDRIPDASEHFEKKSKQFVRSLDGIIDKYVEN